MLQLKRFGHNTYLNEKVTGQVWVDFKSENIWMSAKIFTLVKKIWKLQKIDVSTSILDQFIHLYSFCMNTEQFIDIKLLKNDVFKKNLFKFKNNVETIPPEPVLQKMVKKW